MMRAPAFRPLVISAKRSSWRGEGEGMGKGWQQIREQALQRDSYTCQFCGWTSDKYLEVHHLDDNHENNDLANLVTACRWCHGVHHAGLHGSHHGMFLGIHPVHPRHQLPDQSSIFHIVRALIARPKGLDKDAERRAQEWEQLLHDSVRAAEYYLETADPAVLANEYLLQASEEEYARRADRLSHVRLIPNLGNPLDNPDLPDELRADPDFSNYWSIEHRWRNHFTDVLAQRHGAQWRVT